MKKEQLIRNKLVRTNLKKDHINPEKEPYLSDSEVRDQLNKECGYNPDPATVNNVRQNLILACNFGLNIDSHIVYAWRWSNDNRYAKIGKSSGKTLRERMKAEYHPTDDIILIGVMECGDRKEALDKEQSILNRLGRTRPDREWVEIDQDFYELIDKKFTRIGKLFNKV